MRNREVDHEPLTVQENFEVHSLTPGVLAAPMGMRAQLCLCVSPGHHAMALRALVRLEASGFFGGSNGVVGTVFPQVCREMVVRSSTVVLRWAASATVGVHREIYLLHGGELWAARAGQELGQPSGSLPWPSGSSPWPSECHQWPSGSLQHNNNTKRTPFFLSPNSESDFQYGMCMTFSTCRTFSIACMTFSTPYDFQ